MENIKLSFKVVKIFIVVLMFSGCSVLGGRYSEIEYCRNWIEYKVSFLKNETVNTGGLVSSVIEFRLVGVNNPEIEFEAPFYSLRLKSDLKTYDLNFGWDVQKTISVEKGNYIVNLIRNQKECKLNIKVGEIDVGSGMNKKVDIGIETFEFRETIITTKKDLKKIIKKDKNCSEHPV